MTEAERYPAQVFWSAEDDGFIATAPDLPGCSAFGSTQAEAIAELQDAIQAWIEAAKSAGNPIPGPSQPAPEPTYSGKILLRIPRALHAKLASDAKSEGVSLNFYIGYLLSSATAPQRMESVPTATPSRLQIEPFHVDLPVHLDTSYQNALVRVQSEPRIFGISLQTTKRAEHYYRPLDDWSKATEVASTITKHGQAVRLSTPFVPTRYESVRITSTGEDD